MSPRSSTAERSACNCGGELGSVRDRSLPQGVAFPLRPDGKDSGVDLDRAYDLAQKAMENPHRFTQAMLIQCQSCNLIYVITEENVTTYRRNGSVVKIEKGKPFQISPEYLDAIRENWKKQHGFEDPEFPDTSRVYDYDQDKAKAYRKDRARLIVTMGKRRLNPKQISELVFDLADRYPEKAKTLVAEAEWWSDRATAAPVPVKEVPGWSTLGSALKSSSGASPASPRSGPPTPPSHGAPEPEEPAPW